MQDEQMDRADAAAEEAHEYASGYAGDFGFMVAMREHVEAGKMLSLKQVQAILRCQARNLRDAAKDVVVKDAVTVCSNAMTFEVHEPVTEPGMYRLGEDIFKVQASRENGKLYAKKLVKIGGQRLVETDDVVHFEFEYDRGAIFRLGAQDRMTLEEARAFGIRYGVCCVCGARLKDAESIARGIGPVCGGRI